MAKHEDSRSEKLALLRSTNIKGYRLSINGDQNIPAQTLGIGGSSLVYEVFQELNAERKIYVPRALKLFMMRDDLQPDDADTSFMPASDNFFEEISTVSQLSHENLVQVTDAGEYEFNDSSGSQRKLPYIVSHLIRGCTLREVIENKPNAEFARQKLVNSPDQAVSLILQMARGISYLHNRKILHCDIAPKNIFIEDGQTLRAIVGDVGMSRRIDADATPNFFVAGTRSYTPPEIVRKFGTNVSSKQFSDWFPYWDIFAFSKTCNELISWISQLAPAPWVSAARSKLARALDRSIDISSALEVAELAEYCLPIHRQRGGVPELEPNAVLSRKRMMPIDPLSLTPRIDDLVRHPALTRLQNVPQLNIVRAASPGGNHSRYEHSLGVMENVRRMLSTLIDEPSFLGILTKDSIETGLVAALLYSAHRFPFSNIIHELNKRLPPGTSKIFETFGRDGLLEEVFGPDFRSNDGRTLSEQIERDFPSLDLVKLRGILSSNNVSELTEADDAALYTLLNSSLDARVVDFVRRDSLHLGLSSGASFDLDDLLPHLIISPTAASGGASIQVTLKQTGVSVAEQIILMRYWLYQRVYWNQPNRAYNAAIRRILLDLIKIKGFELEFRRVALHIDERQALEFLAAFAETHKLESTIDLIAQVRSTEKTLYREVFNRSLRQSRSDPMLQDSADVQMLISSTMSYRAMSTYEDALGDFLSQRVDTPSVSRAPLVLLDVPFEPGNIKLGSDIFISVPLASNPKASELRSLDGISPIISGVNDNFANDLLRLRVLVRRDIRISEDTGAILYAELRKLLRR